MKIKLWKKRFARHALALGVAEKDILLVDTKSNPVDVQAAIRSLMPNPPKAKPWTSRWHFLLQYIRCPEFLEPTEQYDYHYLEQTCYQILVNEGFDPVQVREDLIRQAAGYFTHIIFVSDAGTEVRKRIDPAGEFPLRFETSTIPDEPLVAANEMSMPEKTPTIKGVSKDGRILIKLEPEALSELLHVAEAEGMNFTEVVNLVLRRHRHYPRDWREIHEQVNYNILQLELVQELVETSQRHEEMVLRLLESGTVDELIQEVRKLEREGNIVASPKGYKPRPNPEPTSES